MTASVLIRIHVRAQFQSMPGLNGLFRVPITTSQKRMPTTRHHTTKNSRRTLLAFTRQADREYGTRAGRAFAFDGAVVRLHNSLSDGQSQSAAVRFTGGRGAGKEFV